MKKILPIILSWVGGIIFLIYGVGFIIKGFPILSGILLIISSLFVLPITRNVIFKQIQKQPSLVQRTVIVSSLVILSFFWILFNIDQQVNEKKEQERIAQELSEKNKQDAQKEIFSKEKQDFLRDKQNILHQLNNYYNQKNYKDGLLLASKYTKFQDVDVNNIFKKMQGEMRTQELLSLIKTTNESNYVSLSGAYAELVKLNPQNKEYKEKVSYYESKLNKAGKDGSLPKGIQYEGQTTDPTARGMIILVKEKLTKDAINPESVQFQNVFYANQNNMTAICGEINIVKSAGQSGFKRFISNGMDFTAMESHSKNFDKLWIQVCKH